MMRCTSRSLGVVMAVVVLLSASTASAQTIGVFKWRLAPHCNVVTLHVEQRGELFELVGTDDQCGSGVLAAANGSAHVNPNGTIGLAFTVVRPDGLTLATSATVDLATISGSWSDEYANGGAFVFTPSSPAAGEPRRIVLAGPYNVSYKAVDSSYPGSAIVSFGRKLSFSPGAIDNNIVLEPGPPTTNCPGTFEAPRALPGQLCFYEGFSENVSTRRVVNANSGSGADSFGASMFVRAAAPGVVAASGRWVVTIP